MRTDHHPDVPGTSPATDSMRAVVQDGYGGTDVVRLAQVPP
jgi:hypothetical protein